MAFWDRWFGKAPDTGPIVRIILHTEPFDFTGIDRFTILDGPVTAAKKIPFGLQPVREWSEPYDPKRHVVMDGRVPDTIHRFTRPAGPPIDFLIKNGIIIQVTESARGRVGD